MVTVDVSPCSTGVWDASCAMPGWGAAVVSGVVSLLVAVFVLFVTRSGDRLADRRRDSRPAVRTLATELQRVVEHFPQDIAQGIRHLEDVTVARYERLLADLDPELRVKQVRTLAYTVRAVMWRLASLESGWREANKDWPPSEGAQIRACRDYLYSARDSLFLWLMNEKDDEVVIRAPAGVVVARLPGEPPIPASR